MPELELGDLPPEAWQHFESLELTPEEKACLNFFSWLREEHADLSPGYRLNLYQAMYAMLVLEEEPDDVQDSSPALAKFKEYVQGISEVSDDE